MTRKEAIEYLKDERFDAVCDTKYTAEWVDVLDIAIKALEQEPVLNKIRAEIEKLPIAFTSSMEMKKDCLEIIDKYKTESEVQE
ncbi:MAG: hypothetical protein LIR46_07750 [Bacteroidota bacterium]|nr:hypothetical protein [Bacteroidota bacterium]